MPAVRWPGHERTIVNADGAIPSAIIACQAMSTKARLAPVGAKAPDFTLASPRRGTLKLAGYRDRDQVLLVFLRAFG